ncbi:MAG: Serine 3-dehydrogenase [Chlamydiae bacterium]|nr:Serine 3-dehydrogenase [Chlamydiota bacterium]
MKYSSVIITGASSGIGKALSIELSNQSKNLYLLGRNKSKLESVKEACLKRGARVEIFSVDIKDKENMSKTIQSIDKENAVDLVVANAGIGTAQSEKLNNGSPDNIEIIQTNILGIHNTIDPLIQPMKERACGQIAIMSSLAAFRGYSKYYVYNATKAYARIYAQGLRLDLKRNNIKVSTIAPGFVKTPLTDQNPFKMPLVMSSERAAQIILKGLYKNKSLIAFPKALHFLIHWIASLPTCVADKIAEKVV